MEFPTNVKDYALWTYGAAIAMTAIYGGIKGLCKWSSWLQRRKRVTVGQELVDPVLNIGRDGGYMGYYTLSGAGLSALITAGFPVTLPSLIYCSKEVEDEHEE